jgi:hypothetical protein
MNYFEEFKLISLKGDLKNQKAWQEDYKDSKIIIYVTNVTNYFKTSPENHQNLLSQDLEAFKGLVSHPDNNDKKILLYFNMMDIFHKRFEDPETKSYIFDPGKESSFQTLDFTGDKGSKDDVLKFILEKYLKIKKEIFPHWTTLVDEDEFKGLVECLKQVITGGSCKHI